MQTAANTAAQTRHALRACDDAALLERYRCSQSTDAREQLVERFMPLASALAGRHGRDLRSLAVLEQVAALGLIKAVERYDRSCGRPFEAYAAPTITRELEDFLEHRSLQLRIPRELVERAVRVDSAVRQFSHEHGHAPTVEEVAVELGDVDESDVLEALHVRRAATLSSPESWHGGSEDANGDMEGAEQRVLLDTLLGVLGPAERVVVHLRVVDGMTWAQLAVAVGLTEIHVSRIVRRALARMHDAAALQEVARA